MGKVTFLQNGKKFGKLTIASFSHRNKRKEKHYLCKCDCGKEVVVRQNNLTTGHTTTCGCSRPGDGRLKGLIVGRDGSPTCNTYRAMIYRCYDEKHDRYYHYGAKGIKVCERWLGENGYQNFKQDMGERPEGHTLDRIDPTGDYTPENCRWATWEQQMENRRL